MYATYIYTVRNMGDMMGYHWSAEYTGMKKKKKAIAGRTDD